MTTRPTRPKRYQISKLLEQGVQPFEDLDDDTMDALTLGLRDRKALLVPVVLSRDGILLDGHQRLRADLRNGRTFINESDIRFAEEVTADTALEAAVRLNMVRRHYTPEDKGKAALKLQREYGWSQRKLAEFFGVSQPAVAQWLATQDEDNGTGTVTGRDGKTYQRRARKPKAPVKPNQPDWMAMAGQLLIELPVHWGNIPEIYQAEARDLLDDLAKAIAMQLEMGEEASPDFD